MRLPRSPDVAGSAFFGVAEVYVVVVEVELVLGQYPTLLIGAVEPPRPGLGAYYLIRPRRRRETSEHPADPKDLGVLAVALDGLPVHVPDVAALPW